MHEPTIRRHLLMAMSMVVIALAVMQLPLRTQDRLIRDLAGRLEADEGRIVFLFDQNQAQADRLKALEQPTAQTFAEIERNVRAIEVPTPDVTTSSGTTSNEWPLISLSAQGRVHAACVPGVTSEEELLAMLRGIDPGLLVHVGYVGADGNAYALSANQLDTGCACTMDLLESEQKVKE